MEYFLQLFGDYSIGWAIAAICAIIFLWMCYKKVEKYFSDKAIREKEKDEKIQEVIEQAKQYPKWHQQSIDIQQKFTKAIEGLQEGQRENNQRLEKMELENKERERNKLRDRILQSYRYYTSPEKNPMKAWSEMEADAFWKISEDYENLDGDGYVHTDVHPAMRSLDTIPMHETEKLAVLMHSRK